MSDILDVLDELGERVVELVIAWLGVLKPDAVLEPLSVTDELAVSV